MKINLILCSFMMLVLSVSSCEKTVTSDVEIVGYGTSFGMCVDYCVKDLQFTGSQVVFTKKKNGHTPAPKSCTQPIAVAKIEAIERTLHKDQIAKLAEVIGCPDCADGGAEWISVKVGGKVRKLTFEYNHAPEEIKAAVTKLQAIAASFEGCN